MDKNNYWDLCECKIVKLIRNKFCPWKYTAYVRKADVWESWDNKSKTGIDWDGSEWLHPDKK